MKAKKGEKKQAQAEKVPHPVDDLVQAEPRMDAKLAALDPRKLSRLRRIAKLERGFCGEAEW